MVVRAASAFVIACLVATGAAAQARPPFDAALAQAQAGQCHDAVATLEGAIKVNPKGGENLYLLLSDCYTQLGDAAKATATLRGGLRVYPASPQLERSLGQLLFREKFDSSEAGILLAHASKLLPRESLGNGHGQCDERQEGGGRNAVRGGVAVEQPRQACQQRPEKADREDGRTGQTRACDPEDRKDGQEA